MDGAVGPENFRWAESPVETPGEGQMLVRNLWLSFEPTQILSMAAAPEAGGYELGAPMPGLAASEVVESQLVPFRPGDLVYGFSRWEDYSVIDGTGYWGTMKIPTGISPRLAAGTLGITGLVAYFGVVEVGRPRPGETFVASAAAGGVGSVAVQVAKILGARTIGIAGGKEKVDWLRGEAGLDGAIDHRSEEVAKRLDELCPEGIDVYFDNVGGPLLDLALERLRPHGRVVLCGATSRYGRAGPPPGPQNYLQLIMVNGRMEGLLGKDFFDRFPEGMAALQSWLEAGKLHSKEDVVVSLEQAPAALARLFSGVNVGKQLLQISESPASS
ncbi:MAG: NADP-dependent oxidoreductase [Thermoplasmata archaeon]|nr:NADP-dependent oxidoreductase [Thermoplasmata archaeon]